MGILDSLSCPPLGSIVPGARAPNGHVLGMVQPLPLRIHGLGPPHAWFSCSRWHIPFTQIQMLPPSRPSLEAIWGRPHRGDLCGTGPIWERPQMGPVPDSRTGPTVPTLPAWGAERLPQARGTHIPGSPPTGRPSELRRPGSGPRLRHGGRRLLALAL